MEITLVALHMSPHDADRILGWALDLWGDHFPNYSRHDWIDFYSNSLKANYGSWSGQGQELVFVAKQGQELVATISLVDFDELEEFRHLKPWIAAFIVNPELRGTGVGTEVLALLEAKARSLGIDVLHLWTEDKSEFYLKRGYQLVATSQLGELSIQIMKKKFSDI